MSLLASRSLRSSNGPGSSLSALRNSKLGTSHAEASAGSQLSEFSIESFTVSPMGLKLSGLAFFKSVVTTLIVDAVP